MGNAVWPVIGAMLVAGIARSTIGQRLDLRAVTCMASIVMPQVTSSTTGG